MFGIDDALLAAILIGGSGAAEAAFGGKASDREKKMLERLEKRMNQGLDQAEIGRITQRYAPMISRGVMERQRRVARGYGASGGAGSSYAMSDVASLPTVGETLAPIIAEQDLRAREGAERNYMGLEEALTSRRRESVKSGLGLMGSALGYYLTAGGTPDEIGPHGGKMVHKDLGFTQPATEGTAYDENGIAQPIAKTSSYQPDFEIEPGLPEVGSEGWIGLLNAKMVRQNLKLSREIQKTDEEIPQLPALRLPKKMPLGNWWEEELQWQ